MDVSIIIVNYNTLAMTAECIEKVKEITTGVKYEIILIDNGSTDGSREFFQCYPGIQYIYSNENLGFGRANNLGFNYSRGKYIFLLNSDTLLVNNAISKLAVFLDSHPEASIVGGLLLNKDLVPIHSYSLLFPSLLWEINILFGQIITKLIERRNVALIEQNGFCQVAYITGADMMLRRVDILANGFFNPEFFMYFEETELTYRFKQKKLNVYFCPEAKIIHLENASFKIAERRERMFFESRKILYSMIYPAWKRKLVDFIYSITCISRLLVFCSNSQKYSYWKNRFRIFRSVSLL